MPRVSNAAVAAAALAVVGTVIPGGIPSEAAANPKPTVYTGEHATSLRTVAPDPLTLPMVLVPVPAPAPVPQQPVKTEPAPTVPTAPPVAAPVQPLVTPSRATTPPVPPAPPPSEDSTFGARVVATVATYAGIPYVYGGDTPQEGFDCSGLVQYVFRQLGVSVPRVAQAQYDASTHVSHASTRVGDLIFFGSTSAIYHVGIYAGDGKMWVAPRSGKTVELETIWSSNYHVGRFG